MSPYLAVLQLSYRVQPACVRTGKGVSIRPSRPQSHDNSQNDNDTWSPFLDFRPHPLALEWLPAKQASMQTDGSKRRLIGPLFLLMEERRLQTAATPPWPFVVFVGSLVGMTPHRELLYLCWALHSVLVERFERAGSRSRGILALVSATHATFWLEVV